MKETGTCQHLLLVLSIFIVTDVFDCCSYIYDTESGAWVLKVPDEDHETRILTDDENIRNYYQRANDDEMALEEHGLLLAIQAAHDPSTRNSSQQNGMAKFFGPRLIAKSEVNFGVVSEDDTSNPHVEIPPADLFLLVITIHFLICFINGIFVTLAPVWMVSITENGGLDYGVRDCCMAISATGVVLLITRTYCRSKAAMALNAFPVRALRIGAGCTTLFSFALTKFARFNGISPWTALPANTSATDANSISSSWVLWMINSIIGHTYMVEADEVANGGEGLFLYYRPTPASNILSTVIPAMLLGGIGNNLLCVQYQYFDHS